MFIYIGLYIYTLLYMYIYIGGDQKEKKAMPLNPNP